MIQRPSVVLLALVSMAFACGTTDMAGPAPPASKTENQTSIGASGEPARGMYSYMADTGIFRECHTGRVLVVATEGDNAALERAYLAARKAPGDLLLVTVDGHTVTREITGETPPEPVFVVDRFDGLWPEEHCGDPNAELGLWKVFWKLTRLGDEGIQLEPDDPIPHAMFRVDNRVTGAIGCNQFVAPFKAGRSDLSIGAVSMSRRACPDGADLEQKMVAALKAATTWKTVGEHLDLLDEAGRLVARFEAVSPF